MAKKLCERQAAFAREFVVDFNATQAAIRAGYSEKTARTQGSKLLTNLDIQAAIETGKAKVITATELTAEYVVNGLLENHQKAMGRNEGNVANRSLELLGKYLAIFTDVKKIEGDLPPMQVYLTDAEDDPQPDTE